MSRPIVIAALAMVAFALMSIATAGPGTKPGYAPIEVGPIETTAPAPPTVVVERGDHIWKISKRSLSEILQREPSDGEVHPFWMETIEINVDSLLSGDPDLIFPGEELVLPGIDG